MITMEMAETLALSSERSRTLEKIVDEAIERQIKIDGEKFYRIVVDVPNELISVAEALVRRYKEQGWDGNITGYDTQAIALIFLEERSTLELRRKRNCTRA